MAGKRLRDVLSREEFIRLRKEERLTYDQIGEKYGRSGATVAAYGAQVLPTSLRGRLPKLDAQETQAESLPAEEGEELVVRCKRCEFVSEPKRPVNPETGICLWCEKEIEGEDIRAYCESGQAVEQLGARITRTQIEKELQMTLDRVQAGTQPTQDDTRIPPTEPQPQTSLIPVQADTEPTSMVMAIAPGKKAAVVIAVAEGCTPLITQERNNAAWLKFLEAAGDGLAGLKPLAMAAPPGYVRTEEDKWEYLQEIALGHVNIGRGWPVRRKVRQALAAAGRPVIRERTVKALTLLASVADWVASHDTRVAVTADGQ